MITSMINFFAVFYATKLFSDLMQWLTQHSRWIGQLNRSWSCQFSTTRPPRDKDYDFRPRHSESVFAVVGLSLIKSHSKWDFMAKQKAIRWQLNSGFIGSSLLCGHQGRGERKHGTQTSCQMKCMAMDLSRVRESGKRLWKLFHALRFMKTSLWVPVMMSLWFPVGILWHKITTDVSISGKQIAIARWEFQFFTGLSPVRVTVIERQRSVPSRIAFDTTLGPSEFYVGICKTGYTLPIRKKTVQGDSSLN